MIIDWKIVSIVILAAALINQVIVGRRLRNKDIELFGLLLRQLNTLHERVCETEKAKSEAGCIEYYTCIALDDCELDNLVNEQVECGGQPYGTPYTVLTTRDRWEEKSLEGAKNKDGLVVAYAQAMVKYKGDKD